MIQIFVDPGANLSAELREQYNIHLLPMALTINDQPAPEGLDGHEYYEALRSGADVRTSMVNPDDAKKAFETYVSQGDDVVYFSISAGISGSYPIVLVGILFYEKNSESETKIIHYWLYAIFPLTLALINQAFPVFVLLLACELFIFCCGLKLKWLKWNRVNIFGVACMLIFLIIGVYLLSRFYHLFRLQENTGYLQQLDFFSVFREAELIGKSGMPVDVKVMSYFYDHPITLLLYEYGKFSLVFLLFVFGILFAILYRTSKKQDTEVGKLLTNTVLLIYILRIVFTALSDIGVLPNFFMCVPFVVTGGMFIIYDMALIGIILSVNRNESIAKDWIKLKSKRNAAKNGGQL